MGHAWAGCRSLCPLADTGCSTHDGGDGVSSVISAFPGTHNLAVHLHFLSSLRTTPARSAYQGKGNSCRTCCRTFVTVGGCFVRARVFQRWPYWYWPSVL